MNTLLLHRSTAWFAIFAFLAILPTIVTAQSTQELQQQFSSFQQQLTKAGDAFQKKDMEAAGKELSAAKDTMKQLVTGAKTASQRNSLKQAYERLNQAVKAINKNGGTMEDLPSWSDFVKATLQDKKDESKNSPSIDQVSFTKSIAPVLIERCGNCHIRRSSGELSMATFESIQRGSRGVPLITPGNASASRIIEVIEDGSMPQGNQKVLPEELAMLKKWLDQGAKFDGASLTANIAAAGAPASPTTAMVDDFKPPEKLTVSFARDIAPVLVESCKGCHLEAQQIRGNFNMNTFAQLINRAAEDAVFVRGKPDASLLIQKLRGTSGNRMPMNRPPLDEATIVKFETWIKEGASFDGSSPDSPLARVAEQAWVANATPEELKKKRLEAAQANWKRVYAGREAFSASGDHIVVLSDSSEASAQKILTAAVKVTETLQGTLGSKGKPLFPSGATIFVFEKRYDYSEFGKMAEQRSLPQNWTAHWRREGVNAYVAMTTGSSDDVAIERDLKMNLASLWSSSFDGMPRWFADGIGAYAYAARAPKNDPLVSRLEQAAMRTIPTMKNVQPLLQNSINEVDAASIGFLAVRALNQGLIRRNTTVFSNQCRVAIALPKHFDRTMDLWI